MEPDYWEIINSSSKRCNLEPVCKSDFVDKAYKCRGQLYFVGAKWAYRPVEHPPWYSSELFSDSKQSYLD